MIAAVRPLETLMRFGIRTLIALTAICAIGAIACQHFWTRPVFAPPPYSVLHQLESRFENLAPTMDRDQCFHALGLSRYQQFLSLSARMHGGCGIVHAEYFASVPEYLLSFESNFNDKTTTIQLQGPRNVAGRRTTILYDGLNTAEN